MPLNSSNTITEIDIILIKYIWTFWNKMLSCLSWFIYHTYLDDECLSLREFNSLWASTCTWISASEFKTKLGVNVHGEPDTTDLAECSPLQLLNNWKEEENNKRIASDAEADDIPEFMRLMITKRILKYEQERFHSVDGKDEKRSHWFKICWMFLY